MSRAVLREAQETYRLAIEATNAAQATVDRAESALADADAAAAPFVGLEERIAAHQADRLRAGAPSRSIPAGMQRERENAVRARQECETARAARDAVAVDLQAAEAAEAAAEQRVHRAAVDVMRADALLLAEAVVESRRQHFMLRDRLRGLLAFSPPLDGLAAYAGFPASDGMHAALRVAPEMLPDTAEMSLPWRAYFERLIAPPGDAVFDPNARSEV